MKATKLIVLMLAVLLVIAVAACAANRPAGQQGQGQHPGAMASLVRILMPPRPEQLAKIGIGMNVTDQQKADIKNLYQTFNAAVKVVGPTRGEALKGVLTLIQQPTPNKADLQAGAGKVLDADKAILDAEFDFWIGLKGILGAQGSTAVDTFMKNRAMGEMAGGRHGGPGGPPAGGPPPQ